MKKSGLLVVTVVLVLIAGLYVFWHPLESAIPAATRTDVVAVKLDGKLAASAVLRIDPATRSSPAPIAPISLPSPSPFMRAYLEGREWAGLYRRLKDAPATPETQYLQAEILASCAKREAAAGKAAVKADTREQRRSEFLASLSPNDPQLEKRKVAWEKLNVDRCGELAQMDYVADDVNKLVEAASAGGDPRAKAWQLTNQIEEERKAKADGNPRPMQNVLTDAQFATIRALLASQDPLVVEEFRNILSSSIDGGSIRIGPNQLIIDNLAMHHALALVACDFAAPCDENSRTILAACATQGRCDAGNLYDHTLYYGVSPHGAQLVEQYRQWLGQMIGARDLSQLNLVRGPGTPGSGYFFSGDRRR